MGEPGAEDTEDEALECDSEWLVNNCRVRGGGRDCRLDVTGEADMMIESVKCNETIC